jgi:uncharacterized protein (DUF1501 family)
MPIARLTPSRRSLLKAGLGACALPALLGRAQAASASSRRFIFVMNYGGWDPTRVLAPEFDNPNVDMERTAGATTLGNVTWASHADRPAVDAFFAEHYARTAIVKGVLVPSVAHENCLRISMTGSTRQEASDWPAIIAGAQGQAFALPHVVASGPSFPGEFGAYVTRTGTSGQLPALLDGSILSWSDVPVRAPDWRAEEVMDRYVRARAAAVGQANAAGRSAAEVALASTFASATSRASSLKDLSAVLDWSTSSSFNEQLGFAVDALSLGVSRCVTVNFSYYGWDTHASNDLYQSYNWQMLFAALGDLMDQLSATPGPEGAPLADDTVVVVLSEMGRTPQLNSTDGKDHWPYTSLMIVGEGIGNRVVGGYDALYYGATIEPTSGEVSDSGQPLAADMVGATLLRLADVDSEEHLPGVAAFDEAITV